MDEYEKSLQVMDDDGAGSAITSTPVQVSTPERQAIRTVLARRYGPAIPVTEDMVDAVMHEAVFAALPEAEQASRYARFEQGTAGAWLGTYSS